jgi:hypothetical protein
MTVRGRFLGSTAAVPDAQRTTRCRSARPTPRGRKRRRSGADSWRSGRRDERRRVRGARRSAAARASPSTPDADL